MREGTGPVSLALRGGASNGVLPSIKCINMKGCSFATMNKRTQLGKYEFPDPCLLDFNALYIGGLLYMLMW